ncbi:hypothetical protein KIL84_005232 [Mauremys mutica]|uniref:Uncharacterized protein n=1 Tax=Mauremys mutica TaxID=74926 RepID=A0A9D3XL32_9SAUR|nr:hypothetical protein KIL84_005232 [Mauremys mutica]
MTQISPPALFCIQRSKRNRIIPKLEYSELQLHPSKGKSFLKGLILRHISCEGQVYCQQDHLKRKVYLNTFHQANVALSREEMSGDIQGLLIKIQRDGTKIYSKAW